MLTKAQKKKREELKRKLIPVFKGTAALALIFIGFLYWSNGNRSDEPDSGKIYSSEVNERTEKNVSKKNEPQESHKESVTVTQKPVQHVEEEVPQVSVSVT